MAFASGPVSFQRYFTTGRIAAELTDKTLKAIVAHSFGRLPKLPDDTQHGWISPRHILDTEIDATQIAFGRYVHVAIRIDRLRAPASLVKAYVSMEADAARTASGREFLSKGELRRAREAALLRVEQEAAAGSFRRMSAYPVLIDLDAGVVLVGSLGTAVGDRVAQLFSDTFGVAIEPATPQRVAFRLLNPTRDGRALENLSGFHLVRPPDTGEGDGSDLPDRELAFLGKELLTWLWFKSDENDGPLQLREADEVSVMLDRTLRLKCDFGQTGVDTITADGPARLPEARAALRTGKQPVKAGLVLGGPMGELRLTLDGPKLAVTSLILPENQAEQDRRARAEQRFEQIFEAGELLDAIFELFMRERIGREWDRRLREMSAWARGEPVALPRRAASA